MEKTLVVMRGLPGSGKTSSIPSTISKDLICSADDFFLEDGDYNFRPWLIGQAHEACKRKAFDLMSRGAKQVVIDNTNVQRWEFQLYLDFAEAFDYRVVVEPVGTRSASDIEEYHARNTHGVPLEAIQAMADRWED